LESLVDLPAGFDKIHQVIGLLQMQGHGCDWFCHIPYEKGQIYGKALKKRSFYHSL
jgi:hypothetical protein